MSKENGSGSGHRLITFKWSDKVKGWTWLISVILGTLTMLAHRPSGWWHSSCVQKRETLLKLPMNLTSS